ncbi:GNAT family N-acetyltransferase, partial [Vibrio sp. CAIM 722]
QDEQYNVVLKRYYVDDKYDFSRFDCGEKSFNEFLTSGKIDRELEMKITIPYILLAIRDGEEPIVMGYFTLASSCLEKSLYPVSNKQRKKFPYHTVPMVIIGALAIDKRFQGQGAGKKLLGFAIKRAYLNSKDVACLALYLHAFNDKAADFYRRCGWTELDKEPNSFVYPLKQYEEYLRDIGRKRA